MPRGYLSFEAVGKEVVQPHFLRVATSPGVIRMAIEAVDGYNTDIGKKVSI